MAVDNDDDVICLSSDDDCIVEESISTIKKPGIDKGNVKKEKPTLKGVEDQEDEKEEIEVLPAETFPGNSTGGQRKILNGQGHVTAAQIKSAKIGGGKRPDEDVVEISDDEDETNFEIEYLADAKDTDTNLVRNGVDDNDKEKEETTDGDDQTQGEKGEPLVDSVPVIIGYAKAPFVSSDDVDSLVGQPVEPPNGTSYEEAAEFSRAALHAFLTEFRHHAGNGRSRKFRDNAEKGILKMWKAYNEIKHLPQEVHLRLREEIEDLRQSMKAASTKHWTFLKELKDMMQPSEVVKISKVPEEERVRSRNKMKSDLRKKFEKELLKYQKKIQSCEQAEVDWSDEENEHNSPYLLGDKYKKKLMEAFYILCDLSGCNRFTDRPIQKRISLGKGNNSSGYEEIDVALERLVNKGGYLFIPDFTDVLDVVRSTDQGKALGESSFRLAEKMFTRIVNTIKQRREKDFKMDMLARLPRCEEGNVPENDVEASDEIPRPEEEDAEEIKGRWQDPADMDPELRDKLEENEKLKRNEAEVLEEFAQKAMQLQAGNAPENADEENPDAPNSENEEEEDDDGDDEEDDVIDDDEENKIDHKKIKELQTDELVEDEDEESEVVNDWLLTTQEEETARNGDSPMSSQGEAEKESDSDQCSKGSVESSASKKRTATEVDAESDTCQPNKKIRSDENSNESDAVGLSADNAVLSPKQ